MGWISDSFPQKTDSYRTKLVVNSAANIANLAAVNGAAAICSELRGRCVLLVVETLGAWGRTAGQFLSKLQFDLRHKPIPLRLPC